MSFVIEGRLKRNTGNIRIYNAVVGVTYVVATNYTTGNKVVRFTTPADVGTAGIAFRATNASAGAFTITNISLKKVL